MRNWRAGLSTMQVSLTERELVKAVRKAPAVDVEQLIESLFAQPSGKHQGPAVA